MSRKTEIQNAYKYLGKEATFYDGMITCSTIHGKAICNMCKREGCFDLLKNMCKIDFVSQELMGNTLIRTKTLSEGYDVCDFHIIGKR